MIDNREQIEAYSVPHNSYVSTGTFSEQSVDIIMEKAQKLFYHIISSYEKIVSIGISGQMHGILYIDRNGDPVSNLMNWQDKRGDTVLENDRSVCRQIYDITGEKISTGYGVATHYFNILKGIVPQEAVGFCSIMDLFGMKICGRKKPLIHTLEMHASRIFDDELWVHYLQFNQKYRTEVIDPTRLVLVMLDCCKKAGRITRTRFEENREYNCCPHCGRWTQIQLLEEG